MRCVVASQDSFYRGLTPEEIKDVKNFNFDHPDSFDEDAIIHTLMELKVRIKLGLCMVPEPRCRLRGASMCIQCVHCIGYLPRLA